MLEAFFASAAVVALAEIGDKTMLLALVLSARLRAPWAIIGGIFVATIALHAAAALIGSEVAGLVEAQWFRLAVALGFLGMALWMLLPGDSDDHEEGAVRPWGGAFLTSMVSFLIAELGDKSQLATIALGAHYREVVPVAGGAILGEMIAIVPAVLLGKALVARISFTAVRIAAAALFAVLGLWQLGAIYLA